MLKSVYCCVSLLVLGGLSLVPRAEAQAAVYGEFSGTDLTNLTGTNYAFGGTVGVLVEGPTVFHHVVVAGDLQGRFVTDSVEKLDTGALGLRLEFPLKRLGVSPYGEFLIGFARYNNMGMNVSTTDSTIEGNGGVAKRLSPHWDAVAEFSYAQYLALGGEFNPKTVSIGAMYHFTKR